MFCPECGQDIHDGASFCPKCGKDLTAKQKTSEEDAASLPPTPPVDDTAREGAAEEIAEDRSEETAYQPYQPTAVPQPTGSEAPSQPQPAPAPDAMPASPSYADPQQQSGEMPPKPQPSPPPATDASATPPAEKKTKWGPICLIGCGIMLLLAIVISVGLYFVGKSATQKLDELSTSPTQIETDGADDSSASPDIREPGDDNDDDLGEIIGRLGEAIEGAGSAITAANIVGFNPTSVEPAMLPAFYGFMIALSEDDWQGMSQWMSPQLKEEQPADPWTASPYVDHLSFDLDEQTTLDDGTVKFVIDETIQDNEEDAQYVLSWEIHLDQINGEWFVTYFE